ncbi:MULTISPECIES: GntR family transcriptional regulator [Clostridium]|uniref:GntR family transcriptional regulator n=1 Tax=Clostridium cibarium TaxID=2762247 RepID=A0ABR8PW97_9CLOT|nr:MULTISPECIES: GntR family transcriptional regulator [Clostridium]MBD7912412.1 GntR family transcriptional regulator [Clostridium cibarium]
MIQINSRSVIPIYEQIKLKIKELILKDALREGDKLPSVRELAYIMSVNPNTISKSYLSLERDGLIETIIGKGTFVKLGANSILKVQSKKILELDIAKLLSNAKRLNLTLAEIVKMETEIFENIQEEENGRN